MAQREKETCPRSHSQLATQSLGSVPLLGRFDIGLGGWGTYNYLKTLPESQPVPSWGAALRGDSSQKKTPGNSTEVACCWDCCSNPPQRRCWTHCCSSRGTESPEVGHRPHRVWGQQLGYGEHVALQVLGQEKGKKEARVF